MDDYGYNDLNNMNAGQNNSDFGYQNTTRNRTFAPEDILENKLLSNSSYNVLIGIHIMYGVLLTALMCASFGQVMPYIYSSHPIIFTLAFFALSFAGCHLANGQSYGKSMAGYTITVLGFGGILATIIPFFSLEVIGAAAGMTLIILLVMTCAAVFMPDTFLSMGRVIFVALIGLFIAQLVAMIFNFYSGIFSVIGLFIFSLYVGFDWARGQKYPKTSGFAVMAALQLYMDIINIFIRILQLTGNRRR